ncbi:MAG TPA: Crp/Fnr family transcriptional regulator [Henriciella marina]|uniref:Crp/Fnr family transcriptional regulator n=1 Tax=Henriciella sp. TaxID=1968823 RepID=UPI0017FDAFB1|nr:Crp/Fnr family transcriptional regulator [Henriciella sp.]HIG21794.1 Crp/Fnr family transcriptional regulator [Henriciella sp.]HIK63716.1 Crp/Fnr family transcriptional regulator [Henriciella marina]
MTDPSKLSSRSTNAAVFEDLGRFREFDTGQTIIEAEVESSEVFFILSGQVKVMNLSAAGKEIWHNILGPGNTFGEMASLTGCPRTASVIAVEPTRVAILSNSEMLQLIRRDPDIAIWMMRQLSNRLLDANNKLRSLLSLSIGQRVRQELIELGAQQCQSDGTMMIEPVPNLSEMARRLNTERENVSREVSALVAKGVIEKTPERIVILDPDYLSETSLL